MSRRRPLRLTLFASFRHAILGMTENSERITRQIPVGIPYCMAVRQARQLHQRALARGAKVVWTTINGHLATGERNPTGKRHPMHLTTPVPKPLTPHLRLPQRADSPLPAGGSTLAVTKASPPAVTSASTVATNPQRKCA